MPVLHHCVSKDCNIVRRVWIPYLNPIFWTVYGLIESQVDNLDALVTLTTQQQVPVYEAVEVLFGYQ